jgi:Spy/CpxP family protein refolding chaperone
MTNATFRPRVLFPALALFALMGAGAAHAGPPAGKGGKDPHGPGAEGDDHAAGICQRLECTDDQAAKLKAIKQSTRQTIKPLRAQIKDLRKLYADEWVKDKPDAKKLADLDAKIDGAQDAIHAKMRSSMMEIHDILDGAQREKMREMIAKRGGMWGGHGKHHGRGHDGEGKGGKGGKGGEGGKGGKGGKGPNGKRDR